MGMSFLFAPVLRIANNSRHSKNLAVMNQAPQVFDSVLQALDAETIQGHTAERVVAATRGLLNVVGISPAQILASMPVERHNAARRWFM